MPVVRFFRRALLSFFILSGLFNLSSCGVKFKNTDLFDLLNNLSGGSSSSSSSGGGIWAVQLGETAKSTTPESIAIDSLGNVYVTGTTSGNLPSCSGVSATCAGNSQGAWDYYVSKYDSSGVWQWTQQLGETGQNTFALGIGVDSSNNVYVGGYTTGNLVSCGGVSAACAGNSQGVNDYFISKYNSAGVWQWTQQMGQTGMSAGGYLSFNTDSAGNSYITGNTDGNFASCGGVSAACAGASQGTNDYYISKYNSAGTWQWTQQLGQTARSAVQYKSIVDSSSNVFIIGETTGTLPACAGVSGACGGGVSQGTSDVFVSKYTSAGTWQWTQQLGQTARFITATEVATDSTGSVYIGAYTDGDFPACGGVSGACGGGSSANAGFDHVVLKYNSAGTWQWTQQLGQAGSSWELHSLGVDSTGSVYIGGTTDGNIASCAGVSASCAGGSSGSSDMFIVKYSTAGAYQSTLQFYQTGESITPAHTIFDSSDNIYIAGVSSGHMPSCSGVSGFCGGASAQSGFGDYFIQKLDQTSF